jgi:long-chain acyl-CoA synthetase
VSGFNVYPFEVETVIAGHPDVVEVAVIGVPHEQTGETVKAVVVPRPGATLTREHVAARCEERLARFKCPTIIEIADALPHTPTGKIAKARLREQG